MQSISVLKYSTLWAISCSAANPFSLSCGVDYCLNWPQPLPSPIFFIFLLLTFIEAFQRNSPPAIHFLKWSYGEKKKLTQVYVRLVSKWALTYFHFSFLAVVSVSLYFLMLNHFMYLSKYLFFYHHVCLSSRPLHIPSLLLSSSSCLRILFFHRKALQPFEPVLQRGVQELPHGSAWHQSLQIHLWESLLPYNHWHLGLS